MERKNPMSILPVQGRVEHLRQTAASGRNEAAPLISRALQDRSPKVRATAVELIATHKDTSFLNSIHHLLSDPSDLVRSEAIDALGVLEEGSRKHYKVLISCLRDEKPLVRISALETLALLQDVNSIPEIKARLKDSDSLVRAYAAIALAELRSATSGSAISNVLQRENDETAAAGFLVALHLLGDRTRFSQLISLLSSRQYRVRCFVANWLPRLKLGASELAAAKAKVEQAAAHPLGLADASTMSSVREQLHTKSAASR